MIGPEGLNLAQFENLLGAVGAGDFDLDALVAQIAEQEEADIPYVGMGATIHAWSDRYAGTVERVDFFKNGTVSRVLIREDRAIVIGGGVHDGSAEYRYERETMLGYGREWNAVRRRDGSWHDQHWNITFGHRDKYEDPHL